MGLTFVACEQKDPEPESNCTPYSAQFMVDETGGAMYVFELITNDLDIENQSGKFNLFRNSTYLSLREIWV